MTQAHPIQRRLVASITLLGVLWPVALPGAFGQVGSLVKDINPTPTGAPNPGSNPQPLRTSGGVAYFAASDGSHGCELWRSDGSTSGTVMVADLWPGIESSCPEQMIEVAGGALVFAASHPELGQELWRTDGTEAGTWLVKDIDPGFPGSLISEMTAFQGRGWFLANDPTGGLELWTTDGTTAGTTRFADLNPGPGGMHETSQFRLRAIGTRLFFTARSPVNALYVTDGTLAGTQLLAGFNAIAGVSCLRVLSDVNGALLFDGYNGADATLWSSDGTTLGTSQLSGNVRDPEWFVTAGAVTYFSGRHPSTGLELWKTNGSAAGTVPLSDIIPGPGSGLTSDPGVAYPGGLIFPAQTFITGVELFVSDLTVAGTGLLADLATGPLSANPSDFFAIGADVFFAAGGGSGSELYRTDGTSSGTTLFADLAAGSASSSPALLAALGNVRLLRAGGPFGAELLRTDGTLAGTWLVKDIHPPTNSASNPHGLTSLGDRALFAADDGAAGTELWITDGTDAGTTLVRDIRPGPASSHPDGFHRLGDRVLLSAADGVHGVEPWVSDGTAGGTLSLGDLKFGASSSNPVYLANLGDHALFRADNELVGAELWRTDGTVFGTTLVADIAPGLQSSFPTDPVVFDGALYFTAVTTAFGSELWKTDGTAAGTSLAADVAPGSTGSSPARSVVAGDKLFFSAWTPSTGRELFVSDGTAAGITMVIDLNPGPDSGLELGNDFLLAVGGIVVFPADDGTSGHELWRSDGTVAGTFLVKDLTPVGDTQFTFATAAIDRVWFSAGPPYRLGFTDGTSFGTQLLAPVLPQPLIQDYATATSRFWSIGSDSRVLFRDVSQPLGDELWVSDGTAAGTTPITDIAVGGSGSAPLGGTRVGDTLLVSADDGTHGTELYAIPFAATGAWLAEPFGEGCGSPTAPVLSASGSGVLGAGLQIKLTGGAPTTSAVLFASLSHAAVPLPGGCTFLLGAPIAIGATTTGASGDASVGFVIPSIPSLVALPITMQMALASGGPIPGSPALTHGLELLLASP